jgi:hypothetical protein
MLETENPYTSPRVPTLRPLDEDRPWLDSVRVLKVERGFLYRRVVLEAPLEMDLEYCSHKLVHSVSVDGQIAAQTLSVVRFVRRFEFELRSGGRAVPVLVEVNVGRFLRIRAFRIVVEGKNVYTEGNWKPSAPSP